jgi:hypothetical protein
LSYWKYIEYRRILSKSIKRGTWCSQFRKSISVRFFARLP